MKLITIMLVTISVAVLSSCKLQNQIPDLEDHYQTLPSGETLHYYHTGNPSGKPILLLHGYPTSATLYRNIITELCPDHSSEYQCIAVSMVGFGKSSCPGDGSMVSPLYEVEQLESFIQTLDLQNAAFVVHDWGGPIGTLAGLRNSDRFSHLAILNTILEFPEFPILEQAMGLTADFFAQPRPILEALYPQAMSAAIQAMTTAYLSQDVLKQYRAPFQANQDNSKTLANCRIHAGINLFAKGHSDKTLFFEIAQLAPEVWSQKPARFFWSTNDPLLGSKSIIGRAAHADMEKLFPHAATVSIESASHFLQEDKPAEIARGIQDFLEQTQ